MPDTIASPGPALPDDALHQIAASGVVRTFPKSTILIAEGDVGDSLYIIRFGEVEVLARMGGAHDVHIRNLRWPAFFGEMALMSGEPRSATVRARTGVELFEISRTGFLELFRAPSPTAANMNEIISLRMRERRELAGSGEPPSIRRPATERK